MSQPDLKVVQEYERAVVFRLGRLPKGGDKGPGAGPESFKHTDVQNILTDRLRRFLCSHMVVHVEICKTLILDKY